MGLIIMKKDYISPEVNITYVEAYNMIAASVTQIEGDADIELGEGEAPGEADAKGYRTTTVEWEKWDDQEEQQQ